MTTATATPQITASVQDASTSRSMHWITVAVLDPTMIDLTVEGASREGSCV